MEIAWNFASILAVATVLCALVLVFDRLWLRPRRLLSSSTKEPWLVVEAKSFLPVLLVVVLLRSFLVEPFRIPSGSMKPNLLEGDFILVNRYIYGLRLPVFGTKFLSISSPQRGDVVVFHAPFDLSQDFIKRVVGVPGDIIEYRHKSLYVNGKEQSKDFLGVDYDVELDGESWTVNKSIEHLGEVDHAIFIRPTREGGELGPIVVPDGHYFVMGDNRDNSKDSRYWGFVPDELLVGKAFFIWMSWDHTDKSLRFSRIGQSIE